MNSSDSGSKQQLSFLTGSTVSAEASSLLEPAALSSSPAASGFNSPQSSNNISTLSPMGALSSISPSLPADKVREDLARLARFGANICEAHSCFIFIPYEALCAIIGNVAPSIIEERKALVLVGVHSLSQDDIVTQCRLPSGFGLIGWVARHKRSAHVSPFDLDSKTLGLYTNKQELKSFIATPIALASSLAAEYGVLACDSKKSYAFSRVQGKLLEDLSREIANTIDILISRQQSGHPTVMWNNFAAKATEIKNSLGENSIELLRISVSNSGRLELALGTAEYVALSEQLFRLTQQALPPHIPLIRLCNGDLVACLDSMMSSFYESRLRALSERLTQGSTKISLEFRRVSPRDKRFRGLSISELVASTAPAEVMVNLQEVQYGNG